MNCESGFVSSLAFLTCLPDACLAVMSYHRYDLLRLALPFAALPCSALPCPGLHCFLLLVLVCDCFIVST